ncbi:uncharacterized protein LOC100906353 [Galendromus occidentalis]|uniref:Uncharacterized protein LOC100906353 n=1 Tax=Galendromus occidentalis TaxID=34638 RepID=A0AAJ6QTB4_9ACAR|nr:uncharacterized protein LOC100906353 [Galendromus occidentalis]
MSSNFALLVVAAVVLMGSYEVSAFRCYVCNSRNDTDCAKSPIDRRFLKECETVPYENNKEKEPFIVCRHQIVQKEGVVFHDRRCGWKMYAKKREVCLSSSDNLVKTTSCECHTEACNSTSSMNVSLLTIMATVLSLWLIRH